MAPRKAAASSRCVARCPRRFASSAPARPSTTSSCSTPCGSRTVWSPNEGKRDGGRGKGTALTLASPVKFLKGVGPKRAEALMRLGIRTAGDLLYHTPHRYLDATTVTPLARAAVGQDVTCVGRVVSTGVLPTRRGLRVFRAVLKDESGLLECAWPGRPFLERQIKKGQLLLVTGPVRYYHGKQLVPSEFIVLAEPDDESAGDPGLVLPVYPATEGLTHRQIRALVQQHLDLLLPLVTAPHPPAFRASHDLIELRRGLELMHRPKRVEEAELGRRRLAFDELRSEEHTSELQSRRDLVCR